ncbi:hypothetical protein PoB_000753900 [Plakobranchus ocellatus]|uniref:BLOC-1-related complex subunit 7 n=1 Tax=Plakobranchus ocellatus TaxID=259542 RepID=A0AAV3YFF7_9GAST|nr:hypothetical protein PoB_000753900 [Plakobranchus ocellatus]
MLGCMDLKTVVNPQTCTLFVSLLTVALRPIKVSQEHWRKSHTSDENRHDWEYGSADTRRAPRAHITCIVLLQGRDSTKLIRCGGAVNHTQAIMANRISKFAYTLSQQLDRLNARVDRLVDQCLSSKAAGHASSHGCDETPC